MERPKDDRRGHSGGAKSHRRHLAMYGVAGGLGAAILAVGAVGEAVAMVRDARLKPKQEALAPVTRERAQAVVSEATYGTGIVIEEEQIPPVPGSRDTKAYHIAKRVFDVAFSSVAVVVGFVPTAAICLLVALDSKGSPIYAQRRVGRYGIPVDILKIRTMVADADDVEKHLNPEQLQQWLSEHKVDDDPRVTKVGKFLRKTSLDEVPQFLNVLSGSMSVVGPRPVEPDELAAYGQSVAEFLSVTPGITGWWQVKARNDATYEDGSRQRLELEYIRDRSLGRDLLCVFGTFHAMFGSQKTGR
ncbi:sugar transferase [Olsenella phocaeensis]|uniref:sugar transferase n=1 Tax=Olsenella phocaeensis TaxID=1852385 RepID=UPI003A8E6BFF